MIELKNVNKFYNDNNIVTQGLRNINLKLNKGEFVAITGDSGSGKSTLLNVISSIDTYDDGEILFYGNETFYFNQNDSDSFRKDNVSFIFQKYNIIDSYTVLQNVMLPLIIKGKSKDEAKKEALKIIKRVGLENRTKNKGSQLSGGEKQRCVIARALASDASILACDEPTGNLDSKTSKEIIELIKEVSKDKLVLMVTHDYEQIKDICTRKIKLSDGEIVEDITFKDGLEEENKELNLDYKSVNKNVLFRLASLNILSTPRKTIFTTLVFTAVSTILLLLSLLMVKTAYEANYTYDKDYGIISENRLVIYTETNESLDVSKLDNILKDKNYYLNPFYEEIIFDVNAGGFYFNSSLTFQKLNYKLISGKENAKSNELLLIIPEGEYYSGYSRIVDYKAIINHYMMGYDEVSLGNITGVAESKDITRPYLYSKHYNENKDLINKIITYEVELNYYYNNTKKVIGIVKDLDATEAYLEIPTKYKDNIKIFANLKGIYEVNLNFKIKYTDDYDYVKLVIPNHFEGFTAKIKDIKEIIVYSKNINRLEKDIKDLGYYVSIPSKIEDNNTMNLILMYFLMIVILSSLPILLFISYTILQKIYLTKTKDYSIFRTLGIVSNDLKKILHLETLIIGILSIILGIFVSIIIIILGELDLYKYFRIFIIIYYIVLMIVFSLFTSYRLNKKIFKFSVYKSIKEGSE